MISEKKFVYIFVRQDISLPQQLVQASHAAHDSGLAHEESGTSNSIIIFGVKNQEELQKLLDDFSPQISCYPFYESYKDAGLTAFASSPIPEAQRHLFKKFKLWKAKVTSETPLI